jgi:hypothetical protein
MRAINCSAADIGAQPAGKRQPGGMAARLSVVN